MEMKTIRNLLLATSAAAGALPVGLLPAAPARAGEFLTQTAESHQVKADPDNSAESSEHTPNYYKAWRKSREASLRNPAGYLSLTGLFWLTEGRHSIGSAPGNDFVLPYGRGPKLAGYIEWKGDRLVFHAAEGSDVRIDDKPVTEAILQSDAGGRVATRVQIGELTFWVVDRFGRLGIRLSDPASPVLQAYKGTASYPYDASYRVEGRYVPAGEPESVDVHLGSTTKERVVGKVVFEWEGSTYELTGADTSGDDLFIVFGDKTNGKQTYGAGRFLKVPIPETGESTVVDFNLAHNPACAYNKHTTCPFPPARNRLPFPVPAGETMQGLDELPE